jgi:uncharacterized membrane protein
LWERDGTSTFLPLLPRRTSSEAFAINDEGAIVGTSTGPARSTAVLWNPRQGPLALPPLSGHTESHAFAINALGMAAGVSLGEGSYTAVVWHTRTCPSDFVD